MERERERERERARLLMRSVKTWAAQEYSRMMRWPFRFEKHASILEAVRI